MRLQTLVDDKSKSSDWRVGSPRRPLSAGTRTEALITAARGTNREKGKTGLTKTDEGREPRENEEEEEEGGIKRKS